MPTLLASSTSSKLSAGDDLLGIVRGASHDVDVGVKRIPWMKQRSSPLANLKLNALARHNNIKEPTSTTRESSSTAVAVGEEVAGISGAGLGTRFSRASVSQRRTVLVDEEVQVDKEVRGEDNDVLITTTSCTKLKEEEKEMRFFSSCVKEEFGRGGGGGIALEDDSLTSLHWLTGVRVHDCEGKPLQLQYTPPSPAPSGSSCDEGDGGVSDPSSGKCGVKGALKPPYSYATLIIMAMKDNTAGKMTLSEIYRWISDKFVYYQNSPPTWHNSIRHNLSLNKCFKKIPRKKGEPGKGGYWALVPEFADKLLESNIRKRRAGGGQCGDKSGGKRQRLHSYTELEKELMSKFKTEPTDFSGSENTFASCKYDSTSPNTPDIPQAPDTPDSLNSPDNSDHWNRTDCPDMINDACGIELLSELEHCRRDHAYGKSPIVNYDDSDEEKIREIAMHLQGTSSIIDTAIIDTCDSDKTSTSNSKLSTTLSSAIRSGCIWRYDENLSPHDISNDTMELLEAQQYEELSSCTPFEQFCLSPPMSGDDEGYSDDVEDGCYDERRHLDDGLLTVHGTAMTIFESSEGIGDDLLKEELSPTC